jgi:serine/threonine-protein kinase
MNWIGDAAIERLRAIEDRPDFTGTRYDVHERIGRGGMGTVFRGRDRELDRDVAIKVTTLSTAADAERLRAEARTLARLEHPGIVAVHDVGRLADGRVFTVMALVRGERLDVRAAQLPLADRLRLFDRICDTVAFAHAQGIVHRDLTPANIMVGAHGQVLILDWGLAYPQMGPASQNRGLTRVRLRVAAAWDRYGYFSQEWDGGYIAPEAGARVDARADVYALGAILRD